MIYKGVVENNSAVSKVQVRIWGIHSQDSSVIPTEALPWAEVMGSTIFGLNASVGCSSVLQIGVWVYVMLEGGDVDRPIVTGVVVGKDDINSEVQDDHNNVQIIETTSGHFIKISDEKGKEKIEIIHKTGTNVKLDENGDVLIDGVNVDVTASEVVNVKASSVNIDATTSNIGVGGKPIARLDDIVTGGTSDGASFSGTISTCTSVNTSI